MSLDPNYRALLRKNLPQSNPGEPVRKRRKRATPEPKPVEEVVEVSDDSDSSDMEFEDVDIEEAQGSEMRMNNDKSPATIGQKGGTRKSSEGLESKESSVIPEELDSAGSDEFEDLEDVDIDAMFETQERPEENLTFTIAAPVEDKSKSKRKKPAVISKQERKRRKLVHQLYLMTMIAHGVVRNRWCNDKVLQDMLRESIPSGISSHFHPAPSLIDFVKQRHFIEGLRKLVKHWRFRVMAQGLVRKDWGEMSKEQTSVMRNVDLNRFRQTICAYRGSRDMGAQGFVCLLRALGLNARLVFSLQPPDFRSITPVKEDSKKTIVEKDIPEKPKSEFDPVFIPDPRAELLSNIRRGSSTHVARETTKKKFNFPISQYPVFWAEVWNPYSKKWLTVDPIVNKMVEIMPMRKRGKLEPTGSDPTAQTWYVLGFDEAGGIRDVTRRYTQYYNAKTIKKRIDGVSDTEQHWFEQVLRAARSSTRYGLPEIKESQEFLQRDQCEGVPNNLNDFRNHPIYALESQLRKDEVIYPNDESSKCGTFRPMNKDSVVPIYKRSHVFRLRTAKAWYLRGRVLKVGAQPLKTKEKQLAQMEEEDEDEIVRLYAEFQTKLFQAPPIVNGVIPKNAYGNVEIFVPSMMPENGYLVPVTEQHTLKMIERAAREINIDHARAIVAFDFTDQSSKNRRTPAARVGGVLVDRQYKEAMDAIIEGLSDLEEDEKRRKVELAALRGWSFFLKKLMIMDRLNRQHGEVEAEEKSGDEGYYSVASDDASGGDDEYSKPLSREERMKLKREDEEDLALMEEDEAGGFLPNSDRESDVEEQPQYEVHVPVKRESLEGQNEGGFLPIDSPEKEDDGGGFVISDDIREAGGPKLEEDGEFLAEQVQANGPLGEGEFLLSDTDEGGFLKEEPEEGGFLIDEDEKGDPLDKSESEEAEELNGVKVSDQAYKKPAAALDGLGARDYNPTISQDKAVANSSAKGRNSIKVESESEADEESSSESYIEEGLSVADGPHEIKSEDSPPVRQSRDQTSSPGSASLSPETSGALPQLNNAQLRVSSANTAASAKSSKTSSFEEADDDSDHDLQDQIMKEEEEMGFVYSDSE